MPKLGSEGHGKSGHLSDWLRRKAPRRYFTFTFSDKGQKNPFYLTINETDLLYDP